MIQLNSYSDDEKFYRGTIITIKEIFNTPKGKFDIKYTMLGGGMASKFTMLDLYKSIGGCILMDLEPNIEGHFAVNKQGIQGWVHLYFKTFYTPEWYAEWSPKLNDLIYIENLADYFTQANRDLFM